jgi:hypothetical protein
LAGVPNVENAIIEPAKLAGYLLNLGHPKGGPKAKFFLANGFSISTLEQALRTHAIGAEAIVTNTAFGVLYAVERLLDMPSGRSRLVRSVWETRNGETTPRLVTAYPVEPLE